MWAAKPYLTVVRLPDACDRRCHEGNDPDLPEFAAILGGIVLIVDAFKPPSSGGEVLLGVLSLSAGVTRFYMRGRFYKNDSK